MSPSSTVTTAAPTAVSTITHGFSHDCWTKANVNVNSATSSSTIITSNIANTSSNSNSNSNCDNSSTNSTSSTCSSSSSDNATMESTSTTTTTANSVESKPCMVYQMPPSASSSSPYRMQQQHHIHEPEAPSRANNALEALAMLASSAHDQFSFHIASSLSLSKSNTLKKTSMDDSDIMPPPPPRRKMHTKGRGRLRSASNPEGMEKWDSYSYFRHQYAYRQRGEDEEELEAGHYVRHDNYDDYRSSSSLSSSLYRDSYSSLYRSSQHERTTRQHFVLPSKILEEELAQVQETCNQMEEEGVIQHDIANAAATTVTIANSNAPFAKRVKTVFSFLPEGEDCEMYYSYNNDSNNGKEDSSSSPTTVMQEQPQIQARLIPKRTRNKKKKATPDSQETMKSNKNNCRNNINKINEKDDPNTASSHEENENELDLEPKELLHRARIPLFEDLSEHAGLDKALLPLPHAMEKYKEVYNKHGRIGMYTPAERAAIILKFKSKRTRRVWNKKIRYNCRKNLADRRMRVKGRFVKRAVEQENQQQTRPLKANPVLESSSSCSSSRNSIIASSSRTAPPVPTAPPSGPLSTVQEDDFVDEGDPDLEMPDVHDPEAGFRPTLNQPYRRTRRHTIT